MEVLAWGLVVVLLGIVAWLIARDPDNPYPGSVDRLRTELETGGEPGPGRTGDPPEVERLRWAVDEALEERRREARREDPEQRILLGVLRYLGAAVLPALEEARRTGAPAALQDAVDALEDLAFFAREPRDEAARRENLGALLQSVAREYTMETRVPVKFIGPDRPVHLDVSAETLKDALFLLLSNAGRYGEGRTVEISLEEDPRWVRIRIADRGPGFTPDALEHAFEPFWTSDPDALGLGLPHARGLVETVGGRLEIRNREGGGAEAEVRLPTGG